MQIDSRRWAPQQTETLRLPGQANAGVSKGICVNPAWDCVVITKQLVWQSPANENTSLQMNVVSTTGWHGQGKISAGKAVWWLVARSHPWIQGETLWWYQLEAPGGFWDAAISSRTKHAAMLCHTLDWSKKKSKKPHPSQVPYKLNRATEGGDDTGFAVPSCLLPWALACRNTMGAFVRVGMVGNKLLLQHLLWKTLFIGPWQTSSSCSSLAALS